MSQRTARVNALLQREISQVLHTRYRSAAATVTITDVDCSPDLRHARVYYSVVGDAAEQVAAADLFRRAGTDIQQRVGKAVVLKYLPRLEFVFDPSMERGARILELLDELDEEDGR